MARKKKRIEKKVRIGDKRVSVYGFSAFEIQQKIEALERAEELKKDPYFTDVMELWQEEHFKDIAIGTRACYQPAIRRAEKEFKGIRLSEMTPMDITTLLQELGSLDYSLQTVKVQKTVISLVYSYAQSKGLTKDNPAEFAEIPKGLPKKQREIPDDDTISKVMDSTDLPFGMFAFYLLMTGCRRGEVLATRWEDLDFERKTITVNKTIVYNGNRPILKLRTKTSSGMRKIAMLNVLEMKLKEMRANAPNDVYIFGNGDTPFTHSQFRKRWNKYTAEIGIDVTPHQIRHAYATLLYDAGIDEKIAQSFMGHSKIEITRNIYTHIRQQRTAKAQSDLDTYIAKNMM